MASNFEALVWYGSCQLACMRVWHGVVSGVAVGNWCCMAVGMAWHLICGVAVGTWCGQCIYGGVCDGMLVGLEDGSNISMCNDGMAMAMAGA